MGLTYEVTDEQDIKVWIKLSGTFADQDWTGELQRFLETYYLNDGVRFIELEMSQVDFIDLEGVATLLRLSAEAIARGKSLSVTGARGQVWSKLKCNERPEPPGH